MNKKALMIWGGCEGHHPLPITERFAALLGEKGFDTEVSDTLDSLLDVEKLKGLHLIYYNWTMGEITESQLNGVMEAVASGVGLAGCHGGMCDALRNCVQWQFMTGGNWVAHQGGENKTYTVNLKHNSSSPIIEGLQDFQVTSEQYYLHVDPVVNVLATTRFDTKDDYSSPNGPVDMPVTWTKRFGHGRVFYTSIGHHLENFDDPNAQEMFLRGMLWAAEGRNVALKAHADARDFTGSIY